MMCEEGGEMGVHHKILLYSDELQLIYTYFKLEHIFFCFSETKAYSVVLSS